jgi:hypothetical protein
MWPWSGRADPDECLSGSPLVHGVITLSDVVETDLVVEDTAGDDAASQDVAEQVGDVAADNVAVLDREGCIGDSREDASCRRVNA